MLELLSIAWVRKGIEVALIVAAIAGGLYALYRKGEDAGKATEASSQVQASKAELERVESTFQQQLTAQAATVDQERAIVASLLAQFGKLGSQAQAAAAAGAAAKQQLATVPDNQIQQDLEAKLGGPLTSPAILRLDDSIVTDYPHVKEQLTAVVGQVTALQGAQEAQAKELVAVEAQRDAGITAYNEMLPLYAQAYNAAVPRRRHFWCLWICRSKPLALPAPATLKAIK
jgi:hypothetical protein